VPLHKRVLLHVRPITNINQPPAGSFTTYGSWWKGGSSSWTTFYGPSGEPEVKKARTTREFGDQLFRPHEPTTWWLRLYTHLLKAGEQRQIPAAQNPFSEQSCHLCSLQPAQMPS